MNCIGGLGAFFFNNLVDRGRVGALGDNFLNHKESSMVQQQSTAVIFCLRKKLFMKKKETNIGNFPFNFQC